MNSSLDLLTIIAALVAVVVLFWLRGTLGRKSDGEDEARAERFAREAARRASGDNVIPMRPTSATDTPPSRTEEEGSEEEPRRPSRPIYSGPASDGIADITRADPTFDTQHFVAGARAAYEMIVTAYAEGNRKQLKQLLSKEVFDGFQSAIAEREGRGETVELQFVGIDGADIIDAEVRSRTARVTVKFVSQLIRAVRDRASAVIDGDPKVVREVIDEWTFSRDLGSRDPNWKLTATQAAA
jgi:predicted lipid-binding transport protein (Tim44 family)